MMAKDREGMGDRDSGREQAATNAGANGPTDSFEASLAKLEAIVRQLEDGQLGLSDSLARYEEGIRCLKQCHAALETAERKVELLTGVDADGNPVTAPFDDPSLSLEEKAEARSRRRSRGESTAGRSRTVDRAGTDESADDDATDREGEKRGRLF